MRVVILNINGVKIPDEIIKALKNDKFVVFAGAGVSMNEPTSLLGFDGLVKEITKNTGYDYENSDYKNKPDVFLGMLEHNKVRVKERAANYFKERDIKYSNMHKFILELFSDESKIRLVTTNYEYAFEKALSDTSKVKTYSYPALPIGDDFRGIVHIHGEQDSPENMILTDSDFGKAYLLEGTASSFLIKLFKEYTVLFIGYSHEDVIMNYFSRGLPTNENSKRYIFVGEENKTDWNLYGLEPIYFSKHDYDCQTKTLQMLSERVNRNFMEWGTKIEYIVKSNPPTKEQDIDEIKEILYNKILLEIFIQKIKDDSFEMWTKWFYDKGFLDFFGNKKGLTD